MKSYVEDAGYIISNPKTPEEELLCKTVTATSFWLKTVHKIFGNNTVILGLMKH